MQVLDYYFFLSCTSIFFRKEIAVTQVVWYLQSCIKDGFKDLEVILYKGGGIPFICIHILNTV